MINQIKNDVSVNSISFHDGDAGVISHVQFTPNTISFV